MSTDGQDFRDAAQVLNELGDKDLRRDVYAAFRKVAAPLGHDVIKYGAVRMPKRGGFAAVVAAAKFGQSNATTGRSPGVALSFRTRPSHDLKAVDAGILRHPVFPRRGEMKPPWAVTRVPARAFSTPFEAGRPRVARELVNVLENAANDVRHSVERGRR